ncbi:MAG TPA: HAD family phosphatase [Bacteroidales bacterium]|nr:HAD family phosphatase [Bacteroidales bacterium]
MKLKGVVFDFNGTLLWDTPLHNKAWDVFLQRYHLKMTDDEKDKRIHGRNNELIFRDIFNKSLTSEEILNFVEEKESIYRDICREVKIDLAPGARELIAFLKDNRVAFAIATASEIGNVSFYIEFLRLDKLIDPRYILYNDGSYKSKPDPDMFLSAINILGLLPADVLIFEDSYAGIEAALAAKPGKVIIVNSTNKDYSCFKADAIVHFSQVSHSLFT